MAEPSDILVTGGIVREQEQAGVVVATLSTLDADPGDFFTYELLTNPNGAFEIVGDEIRVLDGAAIDFETSETIDLTLQVTDSTGNTYDETITILVRDLNEITGTELGETLNGTVGDDIIDGLGGNDSINGDAGSDIISGGAGADTITGGFGDDLIDGGSENDWLYGNDGADTLLGGDGNDQLRDQSVQAIGNRLEGGAGSDVLYVNASEITNNTLLGGDGLDRLELYNDDSNGTISDNTLDGGNDTSRDELIIYTYRDSITVTNNTLTGGGGDDVLRFVTRNYTNQSFSGNTLLGGDGDDQLNFQIGWTGSTSANNVLDGGSGNDTLSFLSGNGSTTGDVTLIGGDGNDTFSTSAFAGTITMTGGTGVDTFGVTLGASVTLTDFVTGTSGDAINITGVLANLNGYNGTNPFGSGFLQLVEDGNDTLLQVDQDGATGGTTWTTLARIQNTTAANFTADNFTPAWPPAGGELVLGGLNIDDLSGGTGNDELYGYDDDDILDGQEGNDKLFGGSGNDTLTGGAGDDSIDGGADIDTFVLSGERTEYVVTGNVENLTITDTVADRDGTDDLTGVEFVQFATGDPVAVANLFNQAPTITTTALSIEENQTVVGTVVASDNDGDTLTYEIVPGDDGAFFSIDEDSGELSFVTAPDFETRADGNSDNVYDVTVRVSDDNGGKTDQTISVTVTDANEAPVVLGVDTFVANISAANQVLLNDGNGTLTLASIQPEGGTQSSFDAELGDLDGDGDLDAVVANAGQPNQVLLNNGNGTLSLSLTQPEGGSQVSFDVALGDLDGDGDLDTFVANDGQPNQVLLNDGNGTLSLALTQPEGGAERSFAVALGDVDGNGSLDAVVANPGSSVQLLLNDGSAIFTLAGTQPGYGETLPFSWGLALGDVDGDGDLDLFLANRNQPNQLLLNDGTGVFTLAPTQPEGGTLSSGDVALGDLDGDGDLDAFIANGVPNGPDAAPNQVLLNDGNGVFTLAAPPPGGSLVSWDVDLGDVDGDGDLDAVVANEGAPNQLLLNDGTGTFTLASPQLEGGTFASLSVALGDLGGIFRGVTESADLAA